MTLSKTLLIPIVTFLSCGPLHAQQQQKNVVYGEAHGTGLIMDIFTPDGAGNGLGIVDVISGGWDAGRGKIRDHERSQVFKIMCARGYTVFAIRPGSLSRFSIPDMAAHLKTGIMWVKEHAGDYEVDANQLGLMGASAGGHLASLVAVTNGKSAADSGSDDATVKAVAAFFPPTDFLTFGDAANPEAADRVRKIVTRGSDKQLSAEDLKAALIAISPARLVTKDAPPFLLIHGTADQVVPQEQSELLIAALKEKDVEAKLILKEGGGHPWFTIHEEVAVIADYFDERLSKE